MTVDLQSRVAAMQLMPLITEAQAHAEQLRLGHASLLRRWRHRGRVRLLTGTERWLRNPTQARMRYVIATSLWWTAVMTFGFQLVRPGDILSSLAICLPGGMVLGLVGWMALEPSYFQCLGEIGGRSAAASERAELL